MSPPAAGPPLPFEFTVAGTPISHQGDKASRRAWQQAVRAAAAGWGGVPTVAVRLRVAVTYFHEGPETSIDLDNMLKPIQDALAGLV